MSGATRAADCPPGAAWAGERRSGDQVITSCKCSPDHKKSSQQCVLKMPVISPGLFVDPLHVWFIERELAELRQRQTRLQKQMDKLNALKSKQNEYLQQMGEMRQQVIFDGVSSALKVVSSQEFVRHLSGISPGDAEMLVRSTTALKAAIDAVAQTQAGPDRERARAKAVEAAASALTVVGRLALPPAQREALSQVIDVSGETVKTASSVQLTAGEALGKRVSKAFEGAAGILGAAVPAIGVPVAVFETAAAGFVVYRINSDKEAIVNALVSAQRAKLACDQRLAATQDQIAFYEIELKKAGR